MRQPLRKAREGLIYGVLLGCALVSVVTMLGIITVLVSESVPFFREVSVWSYLTGTRWSALLEPRTFGVLPLLAGTVQVACGALALAVPVGLGAAIYLSEYASPRLRTLTKPILEILAGVPTVVYGYFALTFITPDILQRIFPAAEVFNAASAAIVVGIMIVPTIASLCDDALRAVPRSLREGAYALAANRLEVTARVVLPGAFSGVVAAVLLALARALGETMAVTLAAGMTPKLTLNPLTSVQTLTSYIVQVSLGDTPHGTIEYQSIFAVALTLFLITLTINVIAQRMIRRFREEYD
ncbi:MAG: phosphate ABC transporter permease subunit PstC [Phycisphaerales bacterium]|nr:MAG: phosphate ABC transporter permease subunit PstC [Phycisphaerales bacterium]